MAADDTLAATLQARLDDLETRLMFQQETIDTLNDTVTEQWAMLDRAMKKIEALDTHIYELEQASEQNSGQKNEQQKPPHY